MMGSAVGRIVVGIGGKGGAFEFKGHPQHDYSFLLRRNDLLVFLPGIVHDLVNRVRFKEDSLKLFLRVTKTVKRELEPGYLLGDDLDVELDGLLEGEWLRVSGRELDGHRAAEIIMADVDFLRSQLGRHSDFPKPGITFIDIFPLLRSPIAFETLISHFLAHIFAHTIPSNGVQSINAVVGLDARGFLLGPILALRLGASFVPVRKKGKLPGKCIEASYGKEYGLDAFEMQEGSILNGDKVIVIDDLIATGGSAKAAGDLIQSQGGSTLEYLFVIGIPSLKGAEKLNAPSYTIIDTED